MRKHKGNGDGFGPGTSSKSLRVGVELLPAAGGRARALKFSGETTKPQRASEQAWLKAEKNRSPLAPRAMTVHWLSPRFVKDGHVKTAGQPCFAECLPPAAASQCTNPAYALVRSHEPARGLCTRFGKDACMCAE